MSVLAQLRRYRHVRSLFRYPQHWTLPRPTETLSLLAYLQTTGTAAAAPTSWLWSIWRHAVTKDSAYRLQRTCAESTAEVLGLFLSDRGFATDCAGTVGSMLPTERTYSHLPI
jgi:hypothetical protein